MSTDLFVVAFNTRLEAIRRKRKKKLSLCGQNIQMITTELAAFSKLSSLYLCCNEIKSFPFSLLQLKQLSFLSIKANEMEVLPDLCELTKLRDLDVSFNNIRVIGRLPKSIKKLDLSCNNISKLHQSIGDLLKLQSLNVANNPLINLPSSIHNCRYLAKLITTNCLFVAKPATDVLPSLKELAARSLIESNKVPRPRSSNEYKSTSPHEENFIKPSPLKRVSIYRKPFRIMSNEKIIKTNPPLIPQVDSVISLTSLNINENTNAMPKHLLEYFKKQAKCASCNAPIWNYSTRYSTLRRDTEIPLEHRLCSAHWNTNDDRIISFFESDSAI